MTIADQQDATIELLLELARVDAETPGDWSADTANARCQDYAHYIRELLGPTHGCGARLYGVFPKHHCNNV